MIVDLLERLSKSLLTTKAESASAIISSGSPLKTSAAVLDILLRQKKMTGLGG